MMFRLLPFSCGLLITIILGLGVSAQAKHGPLSPKEFYDQAKQQLNAADKVCAKYGFPTLTDVKKTTQCIIPLLNNLKSLTHSPKDFAVVKKMLASKCMQDLVNLNEKCNTPPAVMVGFTPFGAGVVHACNITHNTITIVEEAAARLQLFQHIMKQSKAAEASGGNDD